MRTSGLNKAWQAILLVLIGIVHIIPFYILFNVSFKPTSDTSSYWKPPQILYPDNFTNVWVNGNLGRAIVNNSIITISVIAIVLLVGASSAYPLARFKTKLNNFVYTLFISTMLVPGMTILVPLYKIIRDMFGTSTYPSVIIPIVAGELTTAIFLYTGFISTIPKELDEAALIDGCSIFGIFFRILLPLLKPVTATIIILTGVHAWNDFTYGLFFLQKPSMYNLNVTLNQFMSKYTNETNWVAAGCFTGMIPMTILYLILQKYFMKGLTAGAVKG